MDLSTMSHVLRRDPRGIWTTGASPTLDLSFPEHGHDDLFRIEDESFWFAHRNEVIALALARFPFEGAFLDVGGGNGVVSKHLAKKGIETVILEPAPEGAAHARQRGLENVVCAAIDDAAFAPGSFGAVGLFDVIEHVEDDAKLLLAGRRVLRAGGVLAVTVPAYDWLWSAEDELAGHHRRYTLSRLEDVIERCGYEVCFSSYFFAALTAPLFLARAVPHRLGRRDERNAHAASAAQHVPHPALRRAMDLMLAPERQAIARGRAIPFGTSCLAIGRVPRASDGHAFGESP